MGNCWYKETSYATRFRSSLTTLDVCRLLEQITQNVHPFIKQSVKTLYDICNTYLLYRISKLSIRKLIPQSFNGRQVGAGNVLHIGKVHKLPLLGPGSRNINQGVASKLITRTVNRSSFETTTKSQCYDIQRAPYSEIPRNRPLLVVLT
jgi:hypothetical protein